MAGASDDGMVLGLIVAGALTAALVVLGSANRSSIHARCDDLVAGRPVELRAGRARTVVATEVAAVLGGVVGGVAIGFLPLLVAGPVDGGVGLWAAFATAMMLGAPIGLVLVTKPLARPATVRVDARGLTSSGPPAFEVRWDEPFDLEVHTRRVPGKNPHHEVTWRVTRPDGATEAFTHEVSRSRDWSPPVAPDDEPTPPAGDGAGRPTAWHLGKEGIAVLAVATQAWQRRARPAR